MFFWWSFLKKNAYRLKMAYWLNFVLVLPMQQRFYSSWPNHQSTRHTTIQSWFIGKLFTIQNALSPNEKFLRLHCSPPGVCFVWCQRLSPAITPTATTTATSCSWEQNASSPRLGSSAARWMATWPASTTPTRTTLSRISSKTMGELALGRAPPGPS